MTDRQEADFFACMTLKEELTTRDGKPYVRVGFRDAVREVQFPVWTDSPWAAECRQQWAIECFYKIRAEFRETNFGSQLEIHKIRPVSEADAADGFDPMMLLPRSRHDPQAMLAELYDLVAEQISDAAVRALVIHLLDVHHDRLLNYPAALRRHHAYLGGFLEHALCVAKNASFLAQSYAAAYQGMQPPLDVDLVIAGAILHDFGKLRELEQRPTGAIRSVHGNLVGHVILGRDMLLEAAAAVRARPEATPLAAEKLLRLEHIISSHEKQAEWGAARPIMTPEALIVQAADELDVRFHMLASVLASDTNAGPFTSGKNILQTEVFRGIGR